MSPYCPSPPPPQTHKLALSSEKYYAPPTWRMDGTKYLEVFLVISLVWNLECDGSKRLDTETIQVPEAVTYGVGGGSNKTLP